MTSKSLTVNITDTTSVTLEVPWSGVSQQSLYLQIGYWPVTEDNDAAVLRYLRNKVQRFLHNTRFIFSNLPAGSTIVDVGAGNSIVDMFVELAYPEKNFNYVLIDSHTLEFNEPLVHQVHNCQHSFDNNYVTYNNWDFVRQSINLNSLDENKFRFCDPSNVASIPGCDAVISLASWGWHYPIDTYLAMLHSKLNSGGYLYLSPVLNANDALGKVNDLFGRPNRLNTLEFNASRYQEKERDRLCAFLTENQIPESQFAFDGFWKKQ